MTYQTFETSKLECVIAGKHSSSAQKIKNFITKRDILLQKDALHAELTENFQATTAVAAAVEAATTDLSTK
jgi:hypothetical protein